MECDRFDRFRHFEGVGNDPVDPRNGLMPGGWNAGDWQ
jgi:hypothetical protein